MTRYEIHIPGDDGDRVERVHGDNWLDALRRGLSAAGLPAPTRNLGVAFGKDGAVDITDNDSGAVYKVVPVRQAPPKTATGPMEIPIVDEIDDPFADDDDAGPGLPVRPPVEATRTAPKKSPRRSSRLGAMAFGPYRKQIRQPSNPPPRPGVIDAPTAESGRDTDERRAVDSDQFPAAGDGRDAATQSDPLLRDVAAFERFDGTPAEAAAFLLDRAMHHIPCAAGSVLFIHPRARCLYFTAVRGSKADALVDQRVPLEVGLVGHCVRTRRSLNVADPPRDPRFARTIADTVGYIPSSIVCLPIVSGKRTFGALELLDRLGRETFTEDEEASLRRASRRLGKLLERLLGLSD